MSIMYNIWIMLQTLCPKNFITVQQHLTELCSTEKHENEIRQLFLLRQNTDTPIEKKKHLTIKNSRTPLNMRLWWAFFGNFQIYSVSIFADYVCYGLTYIGTCLHCWIGDMGPLNTMAKPPRSHTTCTCWAGSHYSNISFS